MTPVQPELLLNNEYFLKKCKYAPNSAWDILIPKIIGVHWNFKFNRVPCVLAKSKPMVLGMEEHPFVKKTRIVLCIYMKLSSRYIIKQQEQGAEYRSW